MSFSASCALATLLLWGRPPPEPPSREVLHAEVLRLLEQGGELPREQEWLPLGPEALPELVGLAADPQAPEPRRLRAVAALAVVAHDDAPRRLEGLVRDATVPDALRAAAMEALGRRAGLAAVPPLRPLLGDPREEVRAAAAQALGHLGGPEAREALERQLAQERSSRVRESLQQALSYLEP